VHGKPLVYLDNAATTQKPLAVIQSEVALYERSYANIHRGVHHLSIEASEAYEKAREKAKAFINAGNEREIVFVRGTTEGINLVAQTFRRPRQTGDEVLISALGTLQHRPVMLWGKAPARRRAVNERGEVRGTASSKNGSNGQLRRGPRPNASKR
jgi:cysteine desulfurase/selenocysteine lyase